MAMHYADTEEKTVQKWTFFHRDLSAKYNYIFNLFHVFMCTMTQNALDYFNWIV